MRKFFLAALSVTAAALLLPAVLVPAEPLVKGAGEYDKASVVDRPDARDADVSPTPLSASPPATMTTLTPTPPPGAVKAFAMIVEAEPSGPAAGEDDTSDIAAPQEVLVLDGGKIRSLALEEYVAGATVAEMPPGFPREALRAQAVAIRSLALYRAAHPRHGEAAVCLSADCCTAFREPPSDESDPLWPGAEAAHSTEGLVAAYGGEPIMAAFFASSNGSTMSAADVWGGDVPYLTAVSSPGETARRNGHGVGMSQCGAAAMAENGADFKTILRHYYTDVEIERTVTER